MFFATLQFLPNVREQTETNKGQSDRQHSRDVIEQDPLNVIADRRGSKDECGDWIDGVRKIRRKVQGGNGEQLNGHLPHSSLVDHLTLPSFLYDEPKEQSQAEHPDQNDGHRFVSQRFVGDDDRRRIEASIAAECCRVVEAILTRKQQHGIDEETKGVQKNDQQG